MKREHLKPVSLIQPSSGPLKYIPTQYVSLRGNGQFNEYWLQDRIHEDPSILGLGEVAVLQRERNQPRAGRLDFLLKDVQTGRRFTLELQLGTVDESHIIRTIEYWDNERRRYPHIDHCAVICAETINSRFLNVISLFNGHIPLIAIQVKALQVEDKIALTFTKVLDEVQFGDDERDEVTNEVSRSDWEQKSTPEALVSLDKLVAKLQKIVGPFELKYNKYHIGCVVNGRAANFVTFKPQRNALRVDLGMALSKEQVDTLEKADVEVLDYTHHWKVHPIRLTQSQIANPPQAFFDIVHAAHRDYFE